VLAASIPRSRVLCRVDSRESCFLGHTEAVWCAKEKFELLWRVVVDKLIRVARRVIGKKSVERVVRSVCGQKSAPASREGTNQASDAPLLLAMAAVEDLKVLQKRAYDLAHGDKQVDLKALLEEHPGLDVDEHKGVYGLGALYCACHQGHTECVRLLIDHKAHVNTYAKHGLREAAGAAWG
jgi:hypothetical protein